MTFEEVKEILKKLIDTTDTMNQAIENLIQSIYLKGYNDALEQEPFINKPCISSGVCEHDKNKVLDKIRAEIEQVAEEENKIDKKWAQGLRYALKIIDKYKAESEE